MAKIIPIVQPRFSYLSAREKKVGPVFLNVVAIFLIAMVAMIYLIQNQQVSVKYYQMRQLQATKEELQADLSKIEAELLQAKSVHNVDKIAERLNLTQPQEIIYYP